MLHSALGNLEFYCYHLIAVLMTFLYLLQFFSYINNFLERNEQSGTPIQPGWESRLDIPTNDIVIQGANTTRISRKQVNSY